jgi:hypothetical protein
MRKFILALVLVFAVYTPCFGVSPSKTGGGIAIAPVAVTHPDTVIGSSIDISGKFETAVTIFHSSVEATANTNPGVFQVEVSPFSSGDNSWVVLPACIFPATVSTADTEAMTATEPVGETALAVASTTNIIAGDMLYIQNTTIASSDWSQCQEIVTNTSVNLYRGLTYEQDSNSVIWNDADKWVCVIPIDFLRFQVTFRHEGGTGANCEIKAEYATVDSIQ